MFHGGIFLLAEGGAADSSGSAVWGAIGVVLGALIAVGGKWAEMLWKKCERAKAEKPARDLLIKMLEDARPPHENHWRKLETLRHVIGADEATAKRLLLQVGARASENG